MGGGNGGLLLDWHVPAKPWGNRPFLANHSVLFFWRIYRIHACLHDCALPLLRKAHNCAILCLYAQFVSCDLWRDRIHFCHAVPHFLFAVARTVPVKNLVFPAAFHRRRGDLPVHHNRALVLFPGRHSLPVYNQFHPFASNALRLPPHFAKRAENSHHI